MADSAPTMVVCAARKSSLVPSCTDATVLVQMLRGEAGSDLRQLVDDSPYSIMFGPDKCFRDTNKVGLLVGAFGYLCTVETRATS